MGFTVTEKAMRPASNARACFYCHQSIGAEHKDDCVLVMRPVRIRATIEYVVHEPAGWGKKEVEFKRNEGTWCASNIGPELDAYIEEHPCICDGTTFEFIEHAGEPYLCEEGRDHG